MSMKGIIDWLRKHRMLRIGSYSGVYKNRVAPGDVLDDFDNKVDKEFLDSYKNAEKPTKKGTKMWKKILGTIVVLIGLLIGLVMWATSGMSDVANEFFIHVKSKHYDDAYNMLSDDFKKGTSEEKFKIFLNSTALVNYKDASWGERAFEGNTGTLKGEVITKSGEKIPLTMKFIKTADDSWKIYSIYKPASGIVTDTKEDSGIIEKSNSKIRTYNVPTKEEIKSLIKRDISIFTNSVKNKSMEQFYNSISSIWKEQTNVEKLNNVYGALFNTGIDYTVLNRLEAVIDGEPKLENSVLSVNFHYNTTPKKGYFTLRYIKEDDKWKLIGLNMSIK